MKVAAILLVLLVISFILVFPIMLKPEIHFSPDWVALLDGPHPVEKKPHPADMVTHSFAIGDKFGYVTNSGEMLFRDTKMFGVAIDESRFINFSRVSGNLVVQNPYGDVIDAFEMRGFPMLLDGRLFIISTNRGEFGELDSQGSYKWKYEYTSPITDVDVNNGLVIAGLLDGRVFLYGSDGTIVSELFFERSRIRAVYGCALSHDGASFAVIHGIDPQMLSVYTLLPERSLLFESDLTDIFRTRRRLTFQANGDYLLVEAEDSLIIVDLNRSEQTTVPAGGRLLRTMDSQQYPYTYILLEGEKQAELIVMSLPEAELSRTTISAESVALSGGTGYIVFGADSAVGRIDTIVR